MFMVLSKAGINEMIGTSDIKVSVIIDATRCMEAAEIVAKNLIWWKNIRNKRKFQREKWKHITFHKNIRITLFRKTVDLLPTKFLL